MLDNIMLYWLPAGGASSARLYWESFRNFPADPIDIPVACSIFPKEIFSCSRRWAERKYKNLIYWNELDKGGHFAAFEQPELFVGELRNAFRSLR
jgi:pimeloyl-ACP methyl ester carboxylesterase